MIKQFHQLKPRTMNLSFQDTPISVGIDVHKRQWNVAIYVGNTHHKCFQQPPDAGVLAQYIRRNFPGAPIRSVYECGYFGYHPHRELAKQGIENIVVNAADVAKTHKERHRKTDRIDANLLARGLKNGDLTPIYIPTVEVEADRKLVRLRTIVCKKEVTKCRQRIKDYLMKLGQRPPVELEASWSRKYLEWIKGISDIPATSQYVLGTLLKDHEAAKRKRSELTRAVKELSRTPRYHGLIRVLTSLPGIGNLTAMAFATELVTMERFRNLDHLCGYIGLVPNTYSSGDQERVGRMTNRSHVELRRLLIQAAWVSKRKDPELLLAFERLSKRMSGSRAIIRIAKKLLARIRFCWKQYEEQSRSGLEI